MVCAALLAVLVPSAGPSASNQTPKGPPDNLVLRWNAAVLGAVRDSRLGPPMVSRALAIVHTCMYDAWAAYDPRAVGTRLGASLRQPPGQRTLPHQAEAISFAAYSAASDLFPSQRPLVFDPLMEGLGYDPAEVTSDPDSPAAVGHKACAAVLEFRHRDGANQLGDLPSDTPGVPYADYTGYRSVNPPMDLTTSFRASVVHDPNRWQPLRYRAGPDEVTQTFTAPYWGRVVPFAMPVGSPLRSPIGPAVLGTSDYRDQARELLHISARLTDRHKAIAEYWADGPGTVTPPGHWNLFAQHVSRRDHHGPGRSGMGLDVKLFFALNNAMLDAGIVAWDNKRFYDSVRPVTAIRYLFDGRAVRAWAGPHQGTRLIDGGEWLPYQPATSPTPPFAEYASGHSNFSAAAARTLQLFTGSDAFGLSVTVPAGSSAVEPGAVPAHDIGLHWTTFTEAARQAGLSRRYGGIHFQQGDLDARRTGRACADMAWHLAQLYFRGRTLAHPPPPVLGRTGPHLTPVENGSTIEDVTEHSASVVAPAPGVLSGVSVGGAGRPRR